MASINDDILVERLTPKILTAIRAKSKPVESLSVKADLAGITSLPGYDTTGGQYKKVLVAIEALRKPATDAATTANSAAAAANTAADKANAAHGTIVAAEQLRTEAENARVENEDARITAEENRSAAESERVSEFGRLAAESEAATASANDTATHPTYIGTDNYVYRWNKEAQTYDKTDIYVRGEAFSIKRVYHSIDEMLSDSATDFKEGDFCLIDTGDVENPDNAKLYVRSSVGSWDFLVDMSGAIGFTGKTPQILVGDISIGSGKDSVSVTLSEDGVDTDGNPKYRFNFVIPCLAYDDLTDEQIAELQRPATEAREQVLETESEIQANEDIRLSNETSRKEAESSRVEAENIRKTSEDTRTTNEETRLSNEDSRKQAETEREEAETAREESESIRKENEDTRLTNEDSRKQAESSRVEAENIRKTSEDTRVTNEDARLSNEDSRKEAESSRVEAENIRKTSEDTRTTNEETRLSNEDSRKEAETVREEAESIRVENENIRMENENARKAAETCREESESLREQTHKEMIALNQELMEHPPVINPEDRWEVWNAMTKQYVDTGVVARGKRPVIRDGIWWLWDDDANDYYSSGWAVNSDFQLTKGGIEGVFQGDITSHTHSHLRYVAKVYEELPDLSALDKWSDELGDHDFLLGNDIYVRNETEPTGYANYKLAPSVNGQVWVRIPQVAEGYRVVLVKSENA